MHPLNKISSPEIIAGLPAWPGKKLLSETNQKKMPEGRVESIRFPNPESYKYATYCGKR